VRGGFEGHHFGHWRGVDGPRLSLGVSWTEAFPPFPSSPLERTPYEVELPGARRNKTIETPGIRKVARE